MTDREPRLVLPLVHHFVQQRLEGDRESVAPKRSPLNRVCHSARRSTRGSSSGGVRSDARAGFPFRGSGWETMASRAACRSHFRRAITNRTI